MIKKLSLFFSFIFHPLLMPVAGISILLFTGSWISFIPSQSKKIILLLIVVGTLVLPLLMLPVFLFRKVISDIYLDKRSERLIPFSLTAVFYIFTYIMLRRMPVYHYIYAFMLGCVISACVLFFLNIRWKVSAHMTGLGGLTAFIFISAIHLEVNLLLYLILSIAATGIAASSRLILKAHTPSEVYSGFLLGATIMSASILLY